MNKTVLICTLGILALAVNTAEAGTLNSGVCLSSLFLAGGSNNGNAAIDQLKYQMAIDSFIGIRERYTTTIYNYNTSNFATNYKTDYTYEPGSNFTSINIQASGPGTVGIETEFTGE